VSNDARPGHEAGSIDVLMHVPLRLTAQLGTCRISISDVLKLGTGSIVELDRPAGGPVDLLVNDKVIGRGKVVAVGEKFGVRITELIARSG
jgi:flagellar motor switch protein FliN